MLIGLKTTSSQYGTITFPFGEVIYEMEVTTVPLQNPPLTGPPTQDISALQNPPLTSLHTNTTHFEGYVKLVDLPVVDPHNVGALWNNAGVVTVSAG